MVLFKARIKWYDKYTRFKNKIKSKVHTLDKVWGIVQG
jgi:hypothetical protein